MDKPHDKLEVWKFSMELVKAVYQMTATFAAEERYGSSQQMRRAAVSIPSNPAEGAGRNGAKEYFHFIGMSCDSLAELESQMQLAVMLGLTTLEHPTIDLADRAGKLLTGLHKKWSSA